MSQLTYRVTLAVLLAGCSAGPGADEVDEIAREVITGGQIYGGSLPAKTVVFTYDDGPDEHTLELARYLNEEGIRATFFVNGRRFCKSEAPDGTCLVPPEIRPCTGYEQAAVATPKYYPESWIDELLALGHRVGNHTHDHCYLTEQSSVANLGFEVKATQDILDRHICDGVLLFRAPYGDWNGATAGRINANMGVDKIIGPINWDIDGQDWDCWQKGTSPDACANRYINLLNDRPRQNGIFLMHDRPEFKVGYEGPVLMTKILVPRLRAAGYRIGTLDEALKLPATPDGGTCKPPTSPTDAGTPPSVAPDAAPAPASTTDALGPPVDQPPVVGGPAGTTPPAGPAPAPGIDRPGGAPAPMSNVPAAPVSGGGCRYASTHGSLSAWLVGLLAALMLLARRRPAVKRPLAR